MKSDLLSFRLVCGAAKYKSTQQKGLDCLDTGEQPYECHVCKRRFRDPSSRKRHLRLHEAGRPMRQFIKPTLMLNPETGQMREVILDPKDGTVLRTDVNDGRAFSGGADRKGMFPCAICDKVDVFSRSGDDSHRQLPDDKNEMP